MQPRDNIPEVLPLLFDSWHIKWAALTHAGFNGGLV